MNAQKKKTDAYEPMDSQKTREYKTTGAQKSHEYVEGIKPCTSYSRTNGYVKLRTNGYDIALHLYA